MSGEARAITMGCSVDLSKLPYGQKYVIPMVTSTVALLFMLVSAYSCKFVKVTEEDFDDDDARASSPFFFGLWKTEGRVSMGEGYLGNTNECISWTDTPFYKDGGVRAAKIFSIGASLLGPVVWTLVMFGACREMVQGLRICILSAACAAAMFNIMFFCVFASDVCDDLTCRWGAASYINLTACWLWIVTAATSFVFTKAVVTPEGARDLVTVVTSHSTPTVPTGSTSRPLNNNNNNNNNNNHNDNNNNQQKAASQMYSSTPPTIREAFPFEQGRRRSKGSDEITSNPVDLDDEVGMDELPPVGSPLISITEDEQGNLIKTTITRTQDSQGRTIIDRTAEIIEDNDTSD